MKKILLITSFFIFILNSYSQNLTLSNTAEISFITVAPGKNLFDTWGHSAIRVHDYKSRLDRVYNYGMFDFNAPNFYTNFMKGQLLYSLAAYPFSYFLKGYSNENREVTEQIINLTASEKQNYFNFLENNAKPKNKNYYYDFFDDNCSTKLRDVTSIILKDKVNYHDELLEGNYTHRQLIYQKLDNHPWSKFGIDIALSSIIDKKTTSKQFTFLPSYAFENFSNAQLTNNKPLIKQTKTLYKQRQDIVKKSFFTPMVVFTLLALFILFITYKDFKNNTRNKLLDFSILFSTGIVGLVIVFLWFFTDHKTTANNYNVFWAFLPNLIVAFYAFKNKSFLKTYYLILLGLLVIGIIFWVLKIQIYNWAMIPVLIFMGVRYYYNFYYLKKIVV
ncbi:MAG: DUF4105 domain-containing protein [Flavobacteriaceae bacterium]